MRPIDVQRKLIVGFLAAILVLGLSPAAFPQAGFGVPKIGIVDYYGVRKVSKERVAIALRAKVGDPLPEGKGIVEERIELVNGVVRASVQAVCCEAGKAILYVGIEEKGAPTFPFRDPPTAEVRLPDDIVEAHNEFLEQLTQAVQQGKAQENFSKGHSLMEHPGAYAAQQKFITIAEEKESLLRDVLRTSIDEVHRAIAATIIGYVPQKTTVVDDLQYALQDPDEGVRNNALRSLVPIAKIGAADPSLRLRVSATWIIELMNSVVWTDRNKASLALLALTETRDPRLLSQIKERVWDSLIDMANWQSVGHAMPGFIIAGRCVGMDEAKIMASWNDGTYKQLLPQILKQASQKPKPTP